MPALPVIADVFRCAFEWNISPAQSAATILHFRAPSMSASDVFTVLDTHMNHDLWHVQSDNADIAVVAITPLDGISASIDFPTTGAKWAGASSGQFIPNAPNVVKHTTSARGRSFRGRSFLPAVTESVAIDGFIDGTSAGVITAGWLAFEAACLSDGVTFVIASYKLAVATDVANSVAELPLATMRKRQTRLR